MSFCSQPLPGEGTGGLTAIEEGRYASLADVLLQVLLVIKKILYIDVKMSYILAKISAHHALAHKMIHGCPLHGE